MAVQVPDYLVRFGFILSPCFQLSSFALFVDTLGRAVDDEEGNHDLPCEWQVLGLSGDPVRSSSGVEIVPCTRDASPEEFDYVVIVGGLLRACPEDATETLEFLRAAGEAGVGVVGLSTGSFAMAEAGLLAEKRCAVDVRHRAEFVNRYPSAVVDEEESYVFDGKMITCVGGSAVTDVAAEVVMRHGSRTYAIADLHGLYVGNREFHDALRLPYRELARCRDWRVRRAVAVMRDRLVAPCPTRELAELIGSSVRQIDRAFADHVGMTPFKFWRAIRLEYARWQVLHTSRTITTIAHACGFHDSAHFINTFKQEYGDTPHRFRRISTVPSRSTPSIDARP